jgi:putative transposase
MDPINWTRKRQALSYTWIMRKNHSANFKAQLVLELLKEEKTVSELASAYGVHSTMLHRWKKQVVADLPQLFERDQDAKAAKEAYERHIEDLYTEIGRLSTQLAWLKKKGFDLD